MSSNDFSAEQPPLHEDISPPSPVQGEPLSPPPGQQMELDLPPRSIVQPPRWPHPNILWSLLWCILFMVLTQIPGALVALVIVTVLVVFSPEQFPKDVLTNPAALLQSKPMSAALAVAFFVTEVLVVSFSLLVIRLVVGRDWTRQLALRRPSVAHTFLALASLPALALLGDVAYDFLRKVLHVPSFSDWGVGGMEEMVKVFSQWPWSFAVLVIGLGPGVGEELWCRGFLGRGLVGNYGVVLGVVATSFFFGLIHLDPCQGTMAMFMGLWLHFVYLTTRSLWLPMLLHFLNNSLSVTLPRIPELAKIEITPADIPALVYVSAFVLLGATAYALYQSRARLAPKTPEQIVLWCPTWQGVEYPPSDSGTRVVYPTPSLAAVALIVAALILLVMALAS